MISERMLKERLRAKGLAMGLDKLSLEEEIVLERSLLRRLKRSFR